MVCKPIFRLEARMKLDVLYPAQAYMKIWSLGMVGICIAVAIGIWMYIISTIHLVAILSITYVIPMYLVLPTAYHYFSIDVYNYANVRRHVPNYFDIDFKKMYLKNKRYQLLSTILYPYVLYKTYKVIRKDIDVQMSRYRLYPERYKHKPVTRHLGSHKW